MSLAGLGRGAKVKFQGGTYAGHPASMLAAKSLLSYMVENESEIYPKLASIATKTRETVTQSFADEGIDVRFAGDRCDVVPGNSLHMLLFPYEEGLELSTPDQVRNPSVCDITLSEKVLQLALLLEDVYTVHGIGCTTAAHNEEDIQFLGEACGRAARRVKPYL
jgi:glutamate-1-semialdehyde aminotransferase